MGDILVLSRDDVEQLLDLDELREAVSTAMVEVSRGEVSSPPRGAATVEGKGFVAAMVAHLPSESIVGTKLVAVHAGNHAHGLPSHQAVITVFDADTGTPLAVMDGEHITGARTAAGSAISVAHLARPDASTLGILGTGVQALSHARAVPRVREIGGIRIAGRNEDHARTLAEQVEAETGIPTMTATFAEACGASDIVCATTDAPEPVMDRTWFSPGTHVSSVGFHATGHEVDHQTVVDATVFVETMATATDPFPSGANDLTIPLAKGLIGSDHVRAELGEVIAGDAPGRTSGDELTLYKSIGVAAQDAAAAAVVLRRARDANIGTSVAF